MRWDIISHLYRQREFSARTFGPGERTQGVCNHIREELDEVVADPSDVTEWADILILGLDGAMRAGHKPEEIVQAIIAKQEKNERRQWPDWRGVPEGQPIKHVKGVED